jgi:hypothetical protein
MIGHRLRALLIATNAFAALATPAHAADAWGDEIEVIEDGEMEDLRGGINIAGIEIGFGATVTSTLNGVPVLTTQFTLTNTGAVLQQTLLHAGQDLAALSPEQRSALGLNGFDGLDGIVIEGEGGATAFIHNVTTGTLQNIVVNTANGQDISQSIDISLELPGFDLIQQQMMLDHFGMQISEDLQSMSIGFGD